VVVIEPLANDYTLLPGEELEITSFSRSASQRFNVVESDGATQVYLEDADDFSVT